MSVLLIYPPFSGTSSFNLALPTLAAYLRANKVETRVLDANLAFLKTILTEKNIDEGYQQTIDRFRELNGRDLASGEERQEYCDVAMTLQEAPRFRDNWEESLFTPIPKLENMSQVSDRLQAFSTAVNLVQFPFPDEIRVSHGSGDDSVYHRPRRLSSRYLVDQTKPGGAGILAGFFEDYLVQVLAERRYTIVGISVAFTSQVQAALHCARAIKAIDPRIHVTLGGGFVSTTLRSPSNTALFEVVDSLIVDEGELPLVRLHEELSSPHPDLCHVPALVYEFNGVVNKNEPVDAPAIESQPFPDFTDYDLDDYILPKPMLQLTLQGSRGCSWRRCSFCRVHARFMSCRDLVSPEYVYGSLQSVLEQTGVRKIGFVDAAADTDVLASMSRLIIDNSTRVFWAANFRMEPQLTLEKCMLYRQAGCVSAYFGLEAYNNRILKLIHKGISTNTIDKALSNTSWAGIPSVCYLIAGLPGETEEELLEGFVAVQRMKDEGLLHSYKYSNFELQTGSDIYYHPEKYGLREVRFPEGEDLAGSAEYFEGDVLPQRRASAAARLFNTMKTQPSWSDTVSLNGHDTTLRHDLRVILSLGMEDLHRKVAAIRKSIDL